MKKLLFIFALLVFLPIAHASDAEADRGWDAYNNGNYKKALSIFESLVEQDDAGGQNGLGWLYLQGHGVKKSNTKARKMFRRSAEQGDEWGQYYLGRMYYHGRIGGRRNGKKAAEWLSKSVEQGNTRAQDILGRIYQKGHGVKKSNARALELYRNSALHGDKWGQLHLGEMYYYGWGVEKNFIQAYMWASISLVDNYRNNRNGSNKKRLGAFIKKLEEKMTSEDIKQAESKAKQCIDSNYQDCGE